MKAHSRHTEKLAAGGRGSDAHHVIPGYASEPPQSGRTRILESVHCNVSICRLICLLLLFFIIIIIIVVIIIIIIIIHPSIHSRPLIRVCVLDSNPPQQPLYGTLCCD